MKIAIYHNLLPGGALIYAEQIVKHLYKDHKIDIYSHNDFLPKKYFKKYIVVKLKNNTNIFTDLYNILFELRKINKKIADLINGENYDFIFIFQCLKTGTPYVTKFIRNTESAFLFLNEPKREFYESTTFKQNSIGQLIKQIIRFPIKHIDYSNTINSHNIICNSIYSKHQIKRIYKKDSILIYPGIKNSKPKKLSFCVKNPSFISIGQSSKLKGHHFSINLIGDLKYNLNLIGRGTTETNILKQLAFNSSSRIRFFENYSKIKIDQLLSDKRNIFLANYENEPFGISTLEVIS